MGDWLIVVINLNVMLMYLDFVQGVGMILINGIRCGGLIGWIIR